MYKLDKTKFHEIEHTADIGIMATGNSLEELYANAAFGMLSIIYHEFPHRAHGCKTVELQESDLVELLVSWLSEINFMLTVHHFLPVHILQLQIKETSQNYNLQAVIAGSDSTRQKKIVLHTEIKAVTYHRLELNRNDQGYWARIIFDI
jgi:SHS2 domain-containing protein